MCGVCVEVCPVKALSQSNEFLLSETDKKSKNLIVK
jgi:formate hydrogenlyase subunit 6/NADH:ubiquinone oxidoreductase subunit I